MRLPICCNSRLLKIAEFGKLALKFYIFIFLPSNVSALMLIAEFVGFSAHTGGRKVKYCVSVGIGCQLTVVIGSGEIIA